MKCKRILAILISALMVFSLVACKSSSKKAPAQESTTIFNNVVTEAVVQDASSYESTISDASSAYTASQAPTSAQPESSATSTEMVAENTENINDPANWSTEKIVEEYKNAARKSNANAVSRQSISLNNISVNNGEHENVMSFVGGIIGKFLESNSTEKTGITGGFENLSAQDLRSSKAYKQGNDTVIELYMVEQTSGPNEDANSGSVGHAITAVGDIAVVVNDLSERGLPLELSEQDTKIYYTNPSVKVVVNSNGEIVSGTWFYTVEIRMDNFKAFGQNVNTASIIMDNTITV